MKLIKERSITVVFDAVSISKDIEILGGSLTQNFYSESRTYIPNRFITPISLTPKVYIVDPNNIIPSGDKHEELLECIWYEDGNKIITNDEYKLNKDNTLTVLKNSEKDFTISYSAKWLDPRKKQIITIEDSVQFVTIALGDGNIKPRLTLDKAQNWIHNPLKNERVYSIKAYVSKDKLYEGAVEWYCTLKDAEKKLIDTSFLFYEGGQYSNELKVNSVYMPDCIITAKNISDNKLKEIYWFFDKHGNPLTYAMPDKTIIEGSNVFSLPSSPTVSKLDYKIEGLTLNQLVMNGNFSKGREGWAENDSCTFSKGFVTVATPPTSGSLDLTYMGLAGKGYNSKMYICFDINIKKISGKNILLQVRDSEKLTTVSQLTPKDGSFIKLSGIYDGLIHQYVRARVDNGVIGDEFSCSKLIIVDLTQTFGAGNEPTKEWCDEHITGYFEGTKSVTAPLRIKSEVGGRNLILKSEKRNPQSGFKPSSTPWIDPPYYLSEPLIVGQTYTFSASEFIGESNMLWLYFINPDIEYRFEKDILKLTFTALKPSNSLYIYFKSLSDNGNVQIGNVKLEKGNKATPWTPAPEDNQPATGGTLYINNNLELKSVGKVKDYIENGKLYKYISDDGEILKQTEVINLDTTGQIINHPNGTIVIEPATLVEQQYNDGLKVDLPVKSLTSIKVRAEYLDVSKVVVNDNLITHPKLENGDFVTVEYIYDDSPIYGINSIGYLSLEEILDEYWLENVYTYKVTNGEWELVKITDIENYDEWLKTEKTSPYTLAPDGVIFGKYEADTKFIRQFPSSLYVDFIAPDRLKEGVTQIKARALVGTKDGVIDRPSRYFKITWLKRALRPGQQDIVIGTGDEILVDVGEKDAITIEIEDLGVFKALTDEKGKYLTEENNKILVGR